MRVVEISDLARAGKVRSTAFLAKDARSLVVHVVNAQDQDAAIALKLTGKFATTHAAARTRTSSKEDVLELPELKGTPGTFTDTLPARSMVTFRIEVVDR